MHILYPPTHVAGFEKFAYDYFDANSEFFPRGTGQSSFGPGIYGFYENSTRFRDKTGVTTFSKRKILTPIFLIGDSSSIPAVMYNVHSERLRAATIDAVMDAWEAGRRNVSAVSPLIQLVQDAATRPASLLIYPIAPSHDPDVLVGFVRSIHNWDSLLAQSVPSGVQGIDIVVKDGLKQFTFSVARDRSVRLKGGGSGDLHDPALEQYGRSYSGFLNPAYNGYNVVFYPNADYFPTNPQLQPALGCVGTSVLLLLLASLYWAFSSNERLQKQLVFKQEALDSKRTFVRFISHEIRTPLNTVSMGLRVLHEELSAAGCPPGERLASWCSLVRDIEESSNNAVDVLNELISYDKIEMKTLQLDLALLPVWALVADSIRPFHIQARERGLRIELLLGEALGGGEEGGLLVLGDAARLAQVFRNLVSNALKFGRPGTAVTVRTEWHSDRAMDPSASALQAAGLDFSRLEPAGSVTVAVEDLGPGLSPDHLDKLFKEGVQFNPNKLQSGGGSGLGLWIAHGIVQMHDGLIEASSPGPDRGATFTVTLPVMRLVRSGEMEVVLEVQGEGVLGPGEQGPVIGEQASASPEGLAVRTVLVVDDAASNRKMLCRYLPLPHDE